jgi:hypothetical protein
MSPNVQRALKTWRSTVKLLPSLTEDEALEALDAETAGRNRKSVVSRLVKRLTRLSELNASNLYKDYVPNAHHHAGQEGHESQDR